MDVGRSGPGPLDGSLLTLQSVHRSQVVWDNIEPPPDFRLRTNFGEYWKAVRAHRPHQMIMDAIRDLGFDCIFRLGQFKHDRGLITAFIERWRGETHTFHLPFGEATITLEDVHHILGLPTEGDPLVQILI
nr:PREDICTED: serine/threonine-protein phosphatase 7 long form homolog [Daucus carota subsp. sativus]